MYFRDLTPYRYLLPFPLPEVRNVGWLSAAHPYEQGQVPTHTASHLRVICAVQATNRTRGHYYCEWCNSPVYLSKLEGRYELGSAEIWVKGSAGDIYAAPNLICHYIDIHDYLPPSCFLSAVDHHFHHHHPWSGDHLLDELVLTKTG